MTKLIKSKEDKMLNGTIPDIGLGSQALVFDENLGWSNILDMISDRPKNESSKKMLTSLLKKRRERAVMSLSRE